MEVSSLNRAYVATPAVLTAPASAVSDSVDTLLPQGSQSVAPVAAGSASNGTDNNANGGQSQATTPGQATTVAKFTRDATTNTLVFMEVDPHTDAVIMQFPEEQTLRLKSYLAEVQRHEDASHKSLPGSTVTKTT